MKTKVLLLLLIPVMLLACSQSKEKKAESLIKEYLKAHLNDPSSYEAMHFGSLYEDSTSYMEDPGYVYLNRKNDSIYEAIVSLLERDTDTLTGDEYIKYSEEMYVKIEELEQESNRTEEQMESFKETYKPQPSGRFGIYHKYRAKNGSGALEIYSDLFILNSSITWVEECIKVK